MSAVSTLADTIVQHTVGRGGAGGGGGGGGNTLMLQAL